jgi:3-(methylthio)propanoyl-CoA dehydrogenase
LVYSAAGYVDRAHAGVHGAKARVDLLTPLAKAYGTDIGCEVASLGVQIHGGMGFVEETGAAQHYRDIRIAPIYEGTNGIQAADLVGRKLTGDGGAALKALITEVRADGAGEAALMHLADAVDGAADYMLGASMEDRLAGSYPFLDMVSVMACGTLMARQGKAATSGSAFDKAKRATVRYYLDHIVPEALGKAAAATAGAGVLYELSVEELAA